MADDGFSIGKGAVLELLYLQLNPRIVEPFLELLRGRTRTNTTSAPVIAEAQANKKQSELRQMKRHYTMPTTTLELSIRSLARIAKLFSDISMIFIRATCWQRIAMWKPRTTS